MQSRSAPNSPVVRGSSSSSGGSGGVVAGLLDRIALAPGSETATAEAAEAAGPTPTSRAPAARPPAWRRYGLAIAVVAAAWGLTGLLARLIEHSFSPLFYLAVVVSALYGGLGPGLLATALAALVSAYFFMAPPSSLLIGFDDVLRLAVFSGTAVVISSLSALRRRAEAALRRAHGEMERRVVERTGDLQAANQSLHRQIAERVRVEAELRQAEERFRLLVEGVEDYAIVMLDPGGHVVSWNAGAQRISGYAEAEVAGRHSGLFFPDEDVALDRPQRDLDIAAAEGRFEDEGWRVRKGGSRFWADVVTTALRDEAGGLRGFAMVMRDVTERKDLERAVLEVSEREQRRIGHDLHDGLGQELTAIAFQGKMLEHALDGRGAPESADAGRVTAAVNRAIQQTRELARGLSPVELGADGLWAALRQLAAHVQGVFGIACRAESDESPVRVHDSAAATHLYRIAQEAVNNAVRHARARQIDIRLASTPAGIALTVSDDGVGIPTAPAAAAPPAERAGMGLHLMNYRARMIGAALDVQRGPGGDGGTVVTCTLPTAP